MDKKRFDISIMDVVQIIAVVITATGIITTLWLIPLARWVSLAWLICGYLVCLIVLMNVRAQLENRKRRRAKKKK